MSSLSQYERDSKKRFLHSFYIHMVSQKWLSGHEVDRPFWEQIIRIITPLQLLNNSVDMKSIWTVYFLKYVLFFRIFDLITTVVWIIFCRKLKKINLQERFHRLIADEKYKNIFDSFEKITDRQALEDFYGQVTREHPVVEKFLTPKYKKKKQEVYSL